MEISVIFEQYLKSSSKNFFQKKTVFVNFRKFLKNRNVKASGTVLSKFEKIENKKIFTKLILIFCQKKK